MANCIIERSFPMPDPALPPLLMTDLERRLTRQLEAEHEADQRLAVLTNAQLREKDAEIERLRAELASCRTHSNLAQSNEAYRVRLGDAEAEVVRLRANLATSIDSHETALTAATLLKAELVRTQQLMAAAFEQRDQYLTELQKARAVVEAIKNYRASGGPMWPWPALDLALDALDAIEPYRQVLHTHPDGSHANTSLESPLDRGSADA